MAYVGLSLCAGLCVCLCVRAVKGKRLELSAANMVHLYSMVVARHALTRRSKGQRSRSHGYENHYGRTAVMAAAAVCCCRSGVRTSYDCSIFFQLSASPLV